MKRVIGALILFWAFAGIGLANQLTISDQARAYQYFLLGVVLEADGDLDTALRLYREVLSLDKTSSPEVYYRIATIYGMKGEKEEVEKVLKEMLKKYPDELTGYLWLLRTLLEEGKVQEADVYYEALLKKAIELSPENGKDLYRYLGEYYLKKGKTKKAIEYLKKAVAGDGVDPQPYFLLGALYYEQGEVSAGISYLKKALQKDPDYDLALNFLGYVYVERGENLDEAEKMLKRAVEINPDEPAYLDSLGWLYVKKGDLTKAEEYLKKAAVREDPEIYYHLGFLYFKKGDLSQAKSYLGLALAWAEEGSEVKKKILELLKKIEQVEGQKGSNKALESQSAGEK